MQPMQGGPQNYQQTHQHKHQHRGLSNSTHNSNVKLHAKFKESGCAVSPRFNKIYRTPPTPNTKQLRRKESEFLLDGCAMSSIAKDCARINPKYSSVIPPYNAQLDRGSRNYFEFYGIDDTLRKTGQEFPGTSIEGEKIEKFHNCGPGALYLGLRNRNGCGMYSAEETRGHSLFLADLADKPLGYSGRFGYKRNTPDLRQRPSCFGVFTTFPLY